MVWPIFKERNSRVSTSPLARLDSLDSEPGTGTSSRTINVLLFGEAGAGKSSVVNLIASQQIAQVSSGVACCTLQSNQYNVSIDGTNFSIFDTAGLNAPQMELEDYLTAIEKAHKLIVKINAAGGIHLLLFCMRAGRITQTALSNYRLFREVLCGARVPIALVFTGLEREADMEDWWSREEADILQYGLKNDGHACITAIRDGAYEQDLKYLESQKKMRQLLKDCALRNSSFSSDPHTWFAKLARGMKSFVARDREPNKRDLMRVLTMRCDFETPAAKRIMEMMEEANGSAQKKLNSFETESSAMSLPENNGDRALVVVVFGRSGAGVSSLVNLILGREDAPTSANMQAYTREPTAYKVDINGRPFDIYDTPGFGSDFRSEKFFRSDFRPDRFFRSSYRPERFFRNLYSQRGIDLLMYCLRPREAIAREFITKEIFNTVRSVVPERVPMVGVVTALERHSGPMEDWWSGPERHGDMLMSKGLKFDDHACVTTISLGDRRYSVDLYEQRDQSTRAVRNLIWSNCNGLHT